MKYANEPIQQCISHTQNCKTERCTLRKIRNLEIDLERIFKSNTVDEAQRDTKRSSALGTDRITPIHLHQLGPIRFKHLSHTINLSANSAKIQTSGNLPSYKLSQNGKTHKQNRKLQTNWNPLLHCKTDRKNPIE